MCIKRIAEYWMTDVRKMHAKLMRPAGQWRKLQASAIGKTPKHLPLRRRRLAQLIIDKVPRRMVQIFSQRQIDLPRVAFDLAMNDRQIFLLHFAQFELPAELPMRLGIQGQNHQPGRIAIQTMHD